MPKNIVVLSDGTGQEGGKGADRNTNVYKMFAMLEDRTDRQVVFYDPGLGTDARKITGNAAGAGISKNVRQAYRFIFDHYEVGDRIYLIGFSRGATTVRSLAGFIDKFGILPRSRPELIRKAYAIYKARPPVSSWWAKKRIKSYTKGTRLSRLFGLLKRSDRKTYDLTDLADLTVAVEPLGGPTYERPGRPDVDPDSRTGRRINEFLDAVTGGAGGEPAEGFAKRLLDYHFPGHQAGQELPEHPRQFMRHFLLESRARDFIAANYTYHPKIQFLGCFDTVAALYRIPIIQHKFHDLSLTWSVRNAYQALAIDDERKPFKPAIWDTTYPHQTVRQVWFNGMHTDVGGGYAGDNSGLADISLAWMLRYAHDCGVLLDPGGATLKEDPLDLMHNSRGSAVTKLLYRRAPRPLAPRSEAEADPRPVIHESVFVRALAGQAIELRTASFWKKAECVPVESPALRKRLAAQLRRDGKESDPGKIYKAFVEALHQTEPGKRIEVPAQFAAEVEQWVRYDRKELLDRQEAAWENWIARTALSTPRRFSTAKHGMLSWFTASLAGTEHDRESGVRLWDLASGDQIRALQSRGGVVAVALADLDPEPVAVAASAEGTLSVRYLRTGRRHEDLGERLNSALGGVGAKATALAVVPGESPLLAVGVSRRRADGELEHVIQLHDLAKAAEPGISEGGHGGEILALAAIDGSLVASASWDGTISVWDAASGARRHTLEGHDEPVFALAVTQDGRRLVSGSRDRTVLVWDVGSGEQVAGPWQHDGAVFGVAVTGNSVVAATDDLSAHVWDLDTGKRTAALIGHTDSVRAVAVAGEQIVTGSDDHTIKVWDTSGTELRTFAGSVGHVSALAVTDDGSPRVVSASLERSILHRLSARERVRRLARSPKVGRVHEREFVPDPETALIVVDVQNDFITGSLAVPGADQILPFVNETIDKAWDRGSCIVYTKDWHPQTTRGHFAKDGGLWPVHCVQGTEGADYHADLKQWPEGDRVAHLALGEDGWDGFSAFTERHPRTLEDVPTDLEKWLRNRGISKVAVVGLALDYTVKFTALDAARLGFTTTLLRKGTKAIDEEPGDAERAVADLLDNGVDIV